MRRLSVILFLSILSGVAIAEESESPKEKSGEAALGTKENPILCDDPEGEGWYLSRLRLLDGTDMSWKRGGSTGGGPHPGHFLDVYQSSEGERLYLDMYHPRFVEILAPAGYRLLTEWSNDFEYVDGIIHRFLEKAPFTGDLDIEGKKYRTKMRVEKGLIVGLMKMFYRDGKLRRETEYGSKNRPNGTEKFFKEDGSPWAVYHYREGVLHGDCKYWDEQGVPKDEIYLDGQLVKEKE